MPDAHFRFLLYHQQRTARRRLVELPLRLWSIHAETLFRHQPLEGIAPAELIGASAQYADAPADRDPALEASLAQPRPGRARSFERFIFRSGERRRYIALTFGCSEQLKRLRRVWVSVKFAHSSLALLSRLNSEPVYRSTVGAGLAPMCAPSRAAMRDWHAR